MERVILLAATAALFIGLAAPMARAQEEDEEPGFEEHESGEKQGGNAIDNATAKPGASGPAIDRANLPPEYYKDMGDFWSAFFSGVDPFQSSYIIFHRGEWESSITPPSLNLMIKPLDGPAESILDQLDERGTPLPMVGEAGSQATVAGAAAPTPPAESILDYIDQPASTPAPTGESDAAKPAVNQAPTPPVTQSKP